MLHLAVAVLVATPPAPTWTLSLELFGRGGLWGLAVERDLGDRFYLGGVVSASLLRGDQVYVVAPYAGTRLVLGAHHAWRLDLGLDYTVVHTPSPVPEWDGVTRQGVGAVLSSGWEWRSGHHALRVDGLVVAGQEGVVPWLAASYGWRF